MDASAPGDNDMNVLGTVGDTDMTRVANFCEPAPAAMLQSSDAALAKTRQRDSRPLKHGVLKLFLADTVARHRRCVFRADHKQRPGWKDDVVVAEPERCPDEVIENVLGPFRSHR